MDLIGPLPMTKVRRVTIFVLVSTLTVPRRVIHNNIDNKYTAFAEELRAILGGDLTTNVA